MKLITKKNITAIITIAISLLLPNSAFANPAACTKNADGEITSTADCITTPDTLKLKMNHIYMCYSEPRAPTTSLASNQRNSANRGVCTQQLWPTPYNRNTTEFTVENGTSNSLSSAGGGFRGVVGKQNFTHFTVYLDPSFKMKSKQKFDRTMTASGAGGGSGPWCWTKNTSKYVSRSTGDTVVECGTEAEANAGVGELTAIFNGIGDFPGQSHSYTIDAATIKAYLINSSAKLTPLLTSTSQNESNNVSEILAHVTLPTGTYMESCRNKTKGTRSVSLQWKVSEALQWNISGATVFDVAPSEFYMQIIPKNGGTCH
jgi:hypothetical protein